MNMERTWLNRLQSRLPQVDLRHDTFYDPSSRAILTTDMLVEDVHFCWDYFQPQDLGWRSIAASLSDIAATGGVARWILISMGMPEHVQMDRLEGIYEGIEAICQEFQCVVVGGDTVRSDKTTLSITIMGLLPSGSLPGRRHTAQPGDVIAVSGDHGLSRAGFEVLKNNISGFNVAKQAHLRPIPRLSLGQRVAKVLPHFAMMDSSDGLADAMVRFAEASGVDIVLEDKRLVPHLEVQQVAERMGIDPKEWLLYGGEDFELVVSLPPETLVLFPELKPVGYVLPKNRPGPGNALLKHVDGTVRPLEPEKLFQHFAESPAPQEGAHPWPSDDAIESHLMS